MSAYLFACWAGLARVPEQASSCHIDRSWGLASALLCQGDFKSQSPELWDSRESSRAPCSGCGVKNKPLAKGTGFRLATSPAPSSVELLSTLISFCDSATPPFYKLLHPLSPPCSSYCWLPLLCDELSQLVDQTATQSAAPLSQTPDRPCSVFAFPILVILLQLNLLPLLSDPTACLISPVDSLISCSFFSHCQLFLLLPAVLRAF